MANCLLDIQTILEIISIGNLIYNDNQKVQIGTVFFINIVQCIKIAHCLYTIIHKK